jgi:hypothetical protein
VADLRHQDEGDHIMTTDQNLMLYAKLAGFRLVVLANRFGSDSGFSRELHDRLIEGLDAAIARIHVIMELERNLRRR